MTEHLIKPFENHCPPVFKYDDADTYHGVHNRPPNPHNVVSLPHDRIIKHFRGMELPTHIDGCME